MSDEQTTTEPTPIRPNVEATATATAIPLDPREIFALARHQHLAAWFASETTRLEVELAYVRRAAQGVAQEVAQYVQARYGVTGGALDLEHGLLHVTPPTSQPTAPQSQSGNTQPEQGA